MSTRMHKLYFQIYFWILVYIAISLPLSKYTMSMGSLMLFALWLCKDFQGEVVTRFYRQKGFFTGSYLLVTYLYRLATNNFKEETKKFLDNKPAVIFSFIYIIHLVALLNTSNFSYGIKDLRVKVPLLFFPLVFAGMKKLNYAQFRKLLLFYLAAIFAGTLISTYLLVNNDYLDIREISPFISSIRFGLNVTFGIFILLYFVFVDSFFTRKQKAGMLLMSAWFLIFLFYLESITSLSIILILGLGILLAKILKIESRPIKIAFVLILILIPSSVYVYVRQVVTQAGTVKNSDVHPQKYTAQGNPYTFDSINRGVEDGKYVGWYLCEPELRKAWNRRSQFAYDGNDQKGEALKETLIRYLTSKNLRKDSGGVSKLNAQDIYWIEHGVANVNYVMHPGLRTRILKILKGYEVYRRTGNPSGSSIMQRIEYWKAAWGIIQQHLFFGVGTGDLEDAFYGQFAKMHSQLSPKFMFHAHNQYLAIWVAFGLIGLIVFFMALLYPLFSNHAYRDYFVVVFYGIMLLSMLTDDTLETHAGVSLFAFFMGLMLFGKERENALAE